MSPAVARVSSNSRDREAAPRSERTRAAILAAAEALFSERGFAETRLEDVAERVGIRRASIFYYFADKAVLYDAVLADVFDGFRHELAPVLLGPGPILERATAAVSTWLSYLARRPSTARILLREVADGRPGREAPIVRHTRAYFELIAQVLAESPRDPLASGGPVHPVHLASLVTGGAVFFFAAMPALLPGLGFDPFEPEHRDAYERELLATVRRLLGAA
jgi:TetR/AcrR family transcriptional regulator